MSQAWETTEDDVRLVFDVHNVVYTDEDVERVFEALDHGVIEEGVLHYTDMDDQTTSMCSDIEDKMIELDLIDSKMYHAP